MLQRRRSGRQRDTLWMYLFLLPWLLGIVLFQAGPTLLTLLLSLSDWRGAEAPRWVGLANYRDLRADPLFARTLLNTATYALGSVPLGLALALGLACLLRRMRHGRELLTTLFFLPSVVPGAALTLAWGWVFNPRYGLANTALAALGLAGPGWLHDARWALPTLVLISLWGVGAATIVYLAALARLPQALDDAARIDGAGAWMRFCRITLPLLSPITLFLLLVNTIGAWQIFTPTYMLTRGGPDNATLTAALYIYLSAFSWGRPGYAAAMAWLLFLVTLALTLAQLRLVETRTYYFGDG